MIAKKRTFGDSEKFRVEFKRNRIARTRVSNWTRKYQEDASRQHLNKVGFEDVSDVELGERMSTRGEVVRKRTVVGSFVGRENLSGERGDFSVLPNVNPDICLKGRDLSVHGLISYVEDERGRVFACGSDSGECVFDDARFRARTVHGICVQRFDF